MFVVVDHCFAVLAAERPLWRKQLVLIYTLVSVLNRVVSSLLDERPALSVSDTLAVWAQVLVGAEASEAGGCRNTE